MARLSTAVMTGFALALAASVADAHGPTRQKVSEKIEVNAPPDKVWAIIGNFQDMSWHPAIESTQGDGGNGENATRTLTLKDGGGTIEEKLRKFDASSKTYSYDITKVDVKTLPVTNYASTLSIKDSGGKSTVEWKGAFYRGFPNNDPPPDQTDEAAVKAVTGVYKAGLDAIKAKAEAGS